MVHESSFLDILKWIKELPLFIILYLLAYPKKFNNKGYLKEKNIFFMDYTTIYHNFSFI
jgi:hypothetical protein